MKTDETHVSGLLKLERGFDLFRVHFTLRGAEPPHYGGALCRRTGPDIDLDDVGKLAKRYARVVGGEVVESDAIAKRLQPLAGSDDTVLGLNRFQNLGYGLGGGEQRNEIFEQDFTGAIHEGEAVITKGVDPEKQRGIEGRAGGEFRIGIEIVFHTVAEKKFVSEHILRPVKNGLAGNEALSWQCKRVRCGRLFFDSGLHSFYIGAGAAKLQAELCSGDCPEKVDDAERGVI